jgi:hypothetical protein
MRLFLCLCLLLVACKAHEVRCDTRLQPINLPARPVPAVTPPGPGTR